ncbi:MAG: (d)CMP kinase [Saprospiraceae bacterium]
MKKIIIAIDGYSSCGKSTLAKALSKKLHYAYVDTGAMYRAVTLYFLDHQINFNDASTIKDALEHIEIHFERIDGKNTTFLNGINVENEIRSMRISDHVSDVAAISEVRKALVRQQKLMGKRKGVVMDGRDIGTVVFPEAELKIFLTADPEIRVQRRFDEMKQKGEDINIEEIRNNLSERDRIDTSRSDSPLKQADDALVLDNSGLSEQEQLEIALKWTLALKDPALQTSYVSTT